MKGLFSDWMKRPKTYSLISSRRLRIVSLFLIFTLCLSISSCDQPYNPPQVTALSVKETYEQALSEALKWQLDAQLHSARFGIELNTDSDRNNCTYTFISPTSGNYLNVYFYQYLSGHKLEISEGDWSENRQIGEPIHAEELNLESQKALNIIMESGGNSFFERYRIRREGKLFLKLVLERLDEYNGEGPIIWEGQFSYQNPHAQLYIFIEDSTGELLKIRAIGDQEQDFWLRETAVTERIPLGESRNFFDYFDLRVDKIWEENNIVYAKLTFISPKTTWLIHGEITYRPIEKNEQFSFDDYEITMVQIDKEWIEVEVMPIDRWYKPTPID